VGGTRDNVVFADLNGDGRADYLSVSRTNGAINAWYHQGGQDDGAHALQNITGGRRPRSLVGGGTDGRVCCLRT